MLCVFNSANACFSKMTSLPTIALEKGLRLKPEFLKVYLLRAVALRRVAKDFYLLRTDFAIPLTQLTGSRLV